MGQQLPLQTGTSNSAFQTANEVASSQTRLRATDAPLHQLTFGIDARIQSQLGLPSGVVLSTVVADSPPPLPNPHVSRAGIFGGLARELELNRIVAITGYPESGKSVAISEFAAAMPSKVVWFSCPASETHPDAWLTLLSAALLSYLGGSSISAAEIRERLTNFDDQLLIVIDDAHNCDDLSKLQFVFEAVSANNNLSLLIAGTDDPNFVAKIRSLGFAEWRLPGLNKDQAIAFFQQIVGQLSAHQTVAIEDLRHRVDGHPGILKLSTSSIQQLQNETQAESFIKDLKSSFGGGLDSLLAAMIERLRSGLSEDEIELCKRVSIVLTPFPRRVGKALWDANHPPERFAATWNQCVMKVLEAHSRSRYSLPDLYQSALEKEVAKADIPTIHQMIADAFEDWDGETLDPFEVRVAIIHRILGGDPEQAMNSAARYLASASASGSRVVQILLVQGFSRWLSDYETPSVSVDARIRWHSMCLRTYADLELHDHAGRCLSDLVAALQDESEHADTNSVQLGWTIVLIRASSTGDLDLALTAAPNIDVSAPGDPKEIAVPELMVVSTFVQAGQSPIEYLLTYFQSRAESQESSKRLWIDEYGYVLWRAVLAAIQTDPENQSASGVDGLLSSLETIATNARLAGEPEIATFFDCLYALIQIDVKRDFQRARSYMDEAVRKLDGIANTSVLAFCYDTYGDSLRCSAQDADAVRAYEFALEKWLGDELGDRAETRLMLGIALAKQGKFREGAKEARTSAGLYRQFHELMPDSKSDMSAVRSLLEAASCLIHAEHYAAANRNLLEAHSLLVGMHIDRPEWAALGTVAWSLANRTKPDPQNPETPPPGFTLGLSPSMEGMEEMKPYAPTLMVARSSSAVGRHHRSLDLFDKAIAQCRSSQESAQVAVIAMDAAIEANQLAFVVRYAAIATQIDLDAASEEGAAQSAEFASNYVAGRAIQTASSTTDTAQATQQIAEAIEALSAWEPENAITNLMSSTLLAYQQMYVDQEDVGLQSAFDQALQNNAIWIVRDIAWNWCFRYAQGKPAYEQDYFLWHWRLCWLSFEIGGNDPQYLEGFIEQECSFWDRVPESVKSDNVREVLEVLSLSDELAKDKLLKLIVVLAKIAWRSFNVSDVSTETATYLRVSAHAQTLNSTLGAISIRLLELVLHPGASFVLETLFEDIGRISDAIKLSPSETSLNPLSARIDGLLSIAQVLQSGTPTPEAFDALANARGIIHLLSANAAAQYYVWLRHFGELGREDVFGMEEIMALLNSEHVQELLKSDDLLSYMRVRLGLCHQASKAFAAQREFARALAEINTQVEMQIPIPEENVEAAQRRRETASRTINDALSELEAIESEARQSKLSQDIWSACVEQAGIRHLTAAANLMQQDIAEENSKMLAQSIEDYKRAIAASQETEFSDELTLRSAFSGRAVATYLNDEDSVEYFTKQIEQISKNASLSARIAELAQKEARDILFNIGNRETGYYPDDEESIQKMTDHIMRSSGFPEDRRRFVEDDVRKISESEKEKHNFCQFLQPLQNPIHTRSPHTAYTEKTKYTCSCTILGYTTEIETDDITVAINAMKRAYCDNCDKRKPLGTAP